MAHVRPIPYLPEEEEDERSRLLEYLDRAGGGALPGAGPSAEGLTEAELYGAGTPEPRPGIDTPEVPLGPGDDLSTRRLTPGELVAFDPGFQAIVKGDPREIAPWPLATDSPEVKAAKYEDRRRYVQEGPRPLSTLPAADQIAQQTFGKSWAELTPEEQERLMPSRAGKFRRAGKVIARDKPPTAGPSITTGEARAHRERRAQEKADREAAEREAQAARRGARATRPAAQPRPPGTVADPETERLQNIVSTTIGADELSPAWEGRIAAIRKARRKDRPRMETALIKDAKREWAASARGGVGATPEKRAQQVKDFELANAHTGLKIVVPGRYTDMINKRGSAKVETEIQTTNRATHASSRLIELDKMYGEIPIENLADRFISAEGRAIADEYDFLRDEHMGIILKISGQGMGDAQSRQHIRDGLPDIRTTWSFRSQPRLVGLHRMLVVNAKANLLNMGIEINEPGIGSMNVYHPKKKRKPAAAAPRKGSLRSDEIEW